MQNDDLILCLSLLLFQIFFLYQNLRIIRAEEDAFIPHYYYQQFFQKNVNCTLQTTATTKMVVTWTRLRQMKKLKETKPSRQLTS